MSRTRRVFRRVVSPAALIASLALLAGCASVTPIRQLLDDPGRYDGKSVKIEGRVRESAGAFGLGTYQVQDNTGTLSASLSYNALRNVSLHFDALNLNDPILKMYGANRSQPRAFYANGRQYYFTVRVKL